MELPPSKDCRWVFFGVFLAISAVALFMIMSNDPHNPHINPTVRWSVKGLYTAVSMILFAYVLSYKVGEPDGWWTFYYTNDQGEVVEAKPGRYWFGRRYRLFAVAPEMTCTLHGIHTNGMAYRSVFRITFTDGVTRDRAIIAREWYKDLRRLRNDPFKVHAFLNNASTRTDLPFKVVPLAATYET